MPNEINYTENWHTIYSERGLLGCGTCRLILTFHRNILHPSQGSKSGDEVMIRVSYTQVAWKVLQQKYRKGQTGYIFILSNRKSDSVLSFMRMGQTKLFESAKQIETLLCKEHLAICGTMTNLYQTYMHYIA
jgi:hypothetical protein